MRCASGVILSPPCKDCVRHLVSRGFAVSEVIREGFGGVDDVHKVPNQATVGVHKLVFEVQDVGFLDEFCGLGEAVIRAFDVRNVADDSLFFGHIVFLFRRGRTSGEWFRREREPEEMFSFGHCLVDMLIRRLHTIRQRLE